MNVFEIVKVIQDKITNTTSKEELIYLAKSLENLNLGQVKTVSTYTDLLNIKYPIEGELYFVDNEERLYYGFGSRWILVFNRSQQIAYSWGSGGFAQLGDNASSNRSSPVSITGGFLDWAEIAAGYKHSIALRADGTLWAWGTNNYGQLGTNESSTRSSPVSVVGGFTDWVRLTTGTYHSLALRSNGTLWAWGFNAAGELGDGTTTNRSSPVSVLGGYTDWVFAEAAPNSATFSLGIRSNGTLWAWGDNSFYQLGNGTTDPRSSPALVSGGFTDWISASAGLAHGVGLRSNGTLYAWGFNTAGQIGDGTGSPRSVPVLVSGGFTDWSSVNAGGSHNLGVRSNGTLWAWGSNTNGRLGDGTTSSRSSPVSVVGGFTDWISASAGGSHSLGVRSNGTLWAWGLNSSGRLGDSTITSRLSPVSVVGGFTDWISASAGNSHSMGLRSVN